MCFSQDTCALDRLPPEELSPFLNSDLFCRQRRPPFQVASGGHPHTLLTLGSALSCSCVEEYKLAPDGKSCLMLSDVCEGPKCLKPDSKFNDTLFGEMLHGYNNRTQHVNQGQVFQMTFRYGGRPWHFTG